MDEEKVVESAPENNGPRTWQWITILVLILGIAAAGGALYFPPTHSRMLESKAKETLRSIGSAQLAYQGLNNHKEYGSFKAVQGKGLIGSDCTPTDISPGYSLLWRLTRGTYRQKRASKNPTAINVDDFYAFDVTAYPYYEPRLLHTFAITEEQELLVFDPSKGNDPGDVYSWELVPEEKDSP